MKIDFSFTRGDCKAVWMQFRGYNTVSIKNAYVWYVVAPAISLTILLSGIRSAGKLLLFSTLVSIPLHIAFDKWKFVHWYKDNFVLDSAKVRFSFVANDEGVVIARSDAIETRIAWKSITTFRQNEVITFMYLSPDSCVYIPARAMTAEQRAELDDFFARHGVPKNSC